MVQFSFIKKLQTDPIYHLGTTIAEQIQQSGVGIHIIHLLFANPSNANTHLIPSRRSGAIQAGIFSCAQHQRFNKLFHATHANAMQP